MGDGDYEPLYGSTTASQKWGYRIVYGVLGVFATFTLVVGIIKGVMLNWRHLVLTSNVLIAVILVVYLTYWYRSEDPDPKFQRIIILAMFLALLVSVTTNIYVWTPDRMAACTSDQLFDIKQQTCLNSCKPPQYLVFDTNPPSCVKPPPPPTPPPTTSYSSSTITTASVTTYSSTTVSTYTSTSSSGRVVNNELPGFKLLKQKFAPLAYGF